VVVCSGLIYLRGRNARGQDTNPNPSIRDHSAGCRRQRLLPLRPTKASLETSSAFQTSRFTDQKFGILKGLYHGFGQYCALRTSNGKEHVSKTAAVLSHISPQPAASSQLKQTPPPRSHPPFISLRPQTTVPLQNH
jgi:hypothetical protein